LGVYDLYRKRVNSTLTDSEIAQCEMTQQIKDNFKGQPNYHQVYKNLDNSVMYDVLITNGNVKDKSVGYKMLVSYPYDDFIFDSGDYVNFNYGGVDSTWLLTSIDRTYLYDVKGRIERCNNELKWIDSFGDLQVYKCVIEYAIREDRVKDNKTVMLPDGYIRVQVQENEYTSLIRDNKRFIFNGNAYKIRSIINYVDSNVVTLVMLTDTINTVADDLINNIANAFGNTYEISINQNNFEQEVGYTGTLSYTLLLNGNESNEDVEWISSDETIATINNDGEIELLSEGNVTFTVRMVSNTNISDSIDILVTDLPSGISKNIISPNVTEILQGETQVYTVYNYLDGVQTADTFAITFSGASSKYYELNVIDDNTFSVTSFGYTDTKLNVLCINDTDATQVGKNIQLKGFW
jgi:hypothetical protein